MLANALFWFAFPVVTTEEKEVAVGEKKVNYSREVIFQ